MLRVELLDETLSPHPRKNPAYLELAELCEAIEKASGSEKAELKASYRRKKRELPAHPHMRELKAFREAEAAFKRGKKERLEASRERLKADDPVVQKLLLEEAEAKAERDFYEPYVDLDYDAELAFASAELKLRHLPEAAEKRLALMATLSEKERALENARKEDLHELKEKIHGEQEAVRAELKEHLRDLKAKARSGMISDKARKTEAQAARRAAADQKLLLKLQNPVDSLEEEIRSLRHQLKNDPVESQNVLQSDLSDLRRKIPIEIGDKAIWQPFAGLLLPGLAQFFSGQWVKGCLFFLGTILTWLVAVPYALGYGNYQGQGIAGLFTLAQGGTRVQRSIIFMIEGILALMLLSLSVTLIYFAFRDSWKVRKKMAAGIRPNTWFETRNFIRTDGFPYLVSSPSFFVVLFNVILPVITTILISFTNCDPKHQSKFMWNAGANYSTIVLGQGVAGKAFWLILGWTVLWTLLATSLAIFIGFFFALLVNQERIRFKRFWRTIYLLPWAVPAFITIMFFSIMLAPNGPMTQTLSVLLGHSISVKNDPLLTRTALILLQGWLGSSYIFLLCTGILQSIPGDLYEAAEMDGASTFQKTFRITVPLILYQTAPLMITQYTFNFNNYSIIALFNNGGPFFPSKYGNLAGSSDILISYIYKLTIENQYQGLGAAITVVISIVLMFISWLGFRRTKIFTE